MIKILFSTGQFLVNACKQDWYSLILQLGKNMQMDRNASTEGKDTELLSKFKELFEEITEFSSYKIRNSLYVSTLQNKKSYLYSIGNSL